MIEVLKISLIAYVFCAIGYEENMILSWYQNLLKKLPKWLAFPLGRCYKCFTGQVMFWVFIYKYHSEYDLIDHLFFVSAGIFTAVIYHKIYCWLDA